MRNWTVKWQLRGGFAIVVALFACVMVMVNVLLGELTHGVETINQQTLPFVLAVDEMDLSRSDVQQFLTDVSATHEPAGYKDAEKSA